MDRRDFIKSAGILSAGTVWLHTLEKQAGLEIAEVGLEPRKTQNTRK